MATLLSVLLGSLAAPLSSAAEHASVAPPSTSVLLPTGSRVVQGSGTVTTRGNAVVVEQSSAKLVVNWQSFSIGEQGEVEFVQPDSSSVALNRVIGTDASVIQGRLKSNGQVFLVNPNGVMFSRTAQVDVGGLVASTLDMSDEDFMRGRFVLAGSSAASVANEGQIRTAQGGTIALIAARIVNHGELNASKGRVLMGAGDRVTLDLGGTTLLQVENSTLETLIDNGGVIRAGGGRVLITSTAASTLRQSVINHRGVIEAQSLGVGADGSVVLYATGGTLNNSGSIKAKGSFVETSGKQYNNLAGATVEAGKWLIDPVNITIDAAMAATIQTSLATGDVEVNTAGAGADAGDITVSANIAVTGGSADTTLTLKANRSIIFNADTSVARTGSHKLNVVLWARSAGNDAADDGVLGSVWMRLGSSITTNGGNITIGGGTNPANGYALGDNSVTSAENNARYRGVTINGTLNAAGGNILIRGRGNPSTAARGVSIAGDISTTGSGTITIAGIARGTSAGVALGDSAVSVNRSGTITATNGSVSLTGTRDTGTNGIDLTLASSINVSGTGGLSLATTGNGAILGAGSSVKVGGTTTLTAGTGNIMLTNAANDFGGAASIVSAGNVSLIDSNALTLGTVTASGTIEIATLAGNLSLTGTVSTTDATSNAIKLNAGQSAAAGTSSGGNILHTGGTITTGAGGRATLFTGSITNSTGLTALINSGSGRFRYNSDEGATNYTSGLGSGVYAIYREQPTITVTANAANRTYDGAAYSGGNGVTTTGLVNGDTSGILTGTLSFGGSSQGATNAGSYSITPSGYSNALGYALSYANGTLTIGQRTVTVTGLTANNKMYDGARTATVAGTPTLNGVLVADSANVSLTGTVSGEFNDANVGTNKAVSITGLSLSGTAAGNYSLTAPTGFTANITARPITVTADAKSKIYGDADPTLTWTVTSGSLVAGDTLAGSLTRAAGANVGTYAIDASALANSNYTITRVNGLLTITARPITVTADAKSKIYGDADPTLTWTVTSGSLVAGDTLAGSLTRAAGANVGTYAIDASALANSNYTITRVNGLLTITARPITVTADAKSKIYGDADPTLTWTVTSGSLVAGDTLAGSLTRAAGANVGTYAIDASALANSNYTITRVNGVLTITPRPITVTADAKSKIYGDADPTLTWTVTAGSLVAGDTLTGALSRAAGTNVGTYAIDASALANSNYTITRVNGLLTITARPITVTADAKSKIYGDADPTLTWTVTAGSLVAGDTLAGSLTRAAGANVGTYAIDASALANSNYTITRVNGLLTITARPITVTADAKSKIYGDADPTLTWTVTSGSLVAGDTLAGSLTRAAGANVGTYAIDASALANSNYTITRVNGVLTITPRPITVTADAKSKIYGDADPTLTWTVTSGSLVAGDTLAGSLTRAAGANVGTYAIDASALANSNYTITRVNGVLTITPRPITVTADAKSKIYGDADPTLTWTVTAGSLVAGDTLTGVLTRAFGESVGRYAILTAGLLNPNYLITGIDAEFAILPPRPVATTGAVNQMPTANIPADSLSAARLAAGVLSVASAAPLRLVASPRGLSLIRDTPSNSSVASIPGISADSAVGPSVNSLAGSSITRLMQPASAAVSQTSSAAATAARAARNMSSSLQGTVSSVAKTAPASSNTASSATTDAANIGGKVIAAAKRNASRSSSAGSEAGPQFVLATVGALAVVAITLLFLVKSGVLAKVIPALAWLTQSAGASGSVADALRRVQRKTKLNRNGQLEDKVGESTPDFSVESIVDPEATTCTTMRSDEEAPLTQPDLALEHKPEPLTAFTATQRNAKASGPTLAAFFGLERLLGLLSPKDAESESASDGEAADEEEEEEHIVVAHAKERLQGFVEEHLFGLPGQLIGDAAGELVEQMQSVLEQFSVGRDVLATAWKDTAELVKYRKLTTHTPADHFVVGLVDHQVSFDQCVTLEAKLGEQSLASFDFPINLTVQLSGVRIEMQDGRIKRVHVTDAVATGSVSLGERVILELPEQALPLGTIDLGEGVKLG